MAKELKCPNCGAAAVGGEDGKLRCTNPGCGGTFTFQEGEARLAGVGEFEQLKGKVDQLQISQAELRDLVGSGKGEPPADPPADPAEDPEDPDEEDEDDEDEEDW